ncbi:MAG: GNAT family N-acetyltransferase [Pseudomonadales bacterium]|jgi:RimJ/RimL family protein N-acetyltransferase|uniref:GNAT family N-acetyltransferase n=1 Tax=Pseudomonas sp. p50(2008) TaxID=2816832 RepID=UPI00188A9B96|nr:GNAT family protein [Pseudomonas sp. p50(2008)]MBF4555681.1 GNAT family N-acetyltransferase [Pseudomonas sp. p50(2008)]MBH1967003.1 GNAT family N-acetyltransferase [Pseudomonadales bacterium]MBH2035784.1 GNAT family N-acetyltransferase [Pseudomonadales bacterium]MBH2079531.1 GNAT family N-acetyltransferase [Pseudomonadales bacterium]
MSTSLADWKGAPAPTATLLEGRFIRLEKLDPARHGDDLFNALQGPGADPKLWDYLPYGPFPERNVFNDWLNNHAANSDPYFFCVIDRASGEVQGILSLMSIVPAQGRIEIGHVTFGAPMQRSPKSTEAVYLLAKESFALGYRRLEWKCNNGNARSKYAAERLGFSFEGVFRQHMVVKGQNRDTAWYSILDSEWPAIGAGFERWLSDENQTASGQLKTLAECRG